MRRMYTDNNVVDVVNKAIEDGDIEVSGGTQLYKHTVQASVTDQNDEHTVTCIFISADNTSFAEKSYDILNLNYISGIIDLAPYFEQQDPIYQLICGFTPGTDTLIIVFDEYGSLFNGGLYLLSFNSDVVTAL